MKRVSCRVVRSVPINSGGGAARAGCCGGTGSGGGGFDFARAEFAFSRDSRGFMFGRDGLKAPLAELEAGLALDFLA